MPLKSVNWQARWNQHLAPWLQLADINSLYKSLNNLIIQYKTHNMQDNFVTSHANLINGNDKALSFIAQSDFDGNIAYESFIYETGKIPTRDNLHDFFNACIWFTFSYSKIWLNQQQARCIANAGVHNGRGSIRDAITLFDENGAILITSDSEVDDAINSFDWQTGFVQNRNKWNQPYKQSDAAQAEVYVFGHALLEQLVTPRKPLCAHSLTLRVTPKWFNQSLDEKLISIDTMLVKKLFELCSLDAFNTRSYQPLPILGVPHFWDANQDSEFYNDSYVFRSGRRKK